VLWVGVVLYVIGMIFQSAGPYNTTAPFNLFIIVVAFQCRQLVRERLNIVGNCCEDCMCAFFCTPCTLTQMVGTLWKNPDVQPGCDWNDSSSQVV
jgi:Cys-rich protein (TIGR01571 family)